MTIEYIIFFLVIILMSFTFIAFGVVSLRSKSKILNGGKPCEATVVRCIELKGSSKAPSYRFIMGFTYEGEYMEKRCLGGWAYTPDKAVGKQYTIYYNPNSPELVVYRSIGFNLGCMFMIAMGGIFLSTLLIFV